MSYNVGFIGYRFIAEAHANALARLPMFFPDAPPVNRHAIVGREEEALDAAADRLGFETVTTEWEDVLDAVDVLYNLTPNAVHPEPSIAALERDVPVMCEKPLAATLPEAERMAEAAERSDAAAATAFNYRFIPAIQHAKGLIEEGHLGEIRQVRGRYYQDWLVDPEAPWSWRNSEEMAGSGALGDLGSHTVDLLRYLVGDVVGEFDRVGGRLTTFVDERPVPGESGTRPVTVDDAYTAHVEFESGAVGTLEASRCADGHKNDHLIAVYGSEGAIRFSLDRLNELEVKTDGDRGFESVLVTEPEDPYYDHWWPPGHVIGWEHAFVHENYEFLTALDGDVEYHPNFQDGLAVQRVLDAIERSDRDETWVDV
ncbi:Gfo/Idh/MocA family protein [Halopenitus sp. H-Gu1]|uniref:Gfo/Idh/MocA family protein n=1 Tax=Halopenitus sp. H-Gu1 TaxID=3242697 RepID=UPI00359D851A